MLPGSHYLILIFCFILHISYLEPFHCPQKTSPISIFLILFSFHILYFLSLVCLYSKNMMFSFISKANIYILILIPLPFTWTLLFSVILIMLHAGFSVLPYFYSFPILPITTELVWFILTLVVQFINSFSTTFCSLTVVSTNVLFPWVKVNFFSYLTR